MTQAFNLSQLANNLNTSGQLDATDGLTGSVPVANGGTGQSSLTANAVLVGNGTSGINSVAPSTSGNILTSNGTSWVSQAPSGGGVTSFNGNTGAINGYELITSGTFGSGTTTISIGSLPSGYKVFKVILVGTLSTALSNFQAGWRFSTNGGSSYVETNSYGARGVPNLAGGGANSFAYNLTQSSMEFGYFCAESNSILYFVQEMDVYQSTGSSLVSVRGNFSSLANSDTNSSGSSQFGGWFNSTSYVNGIRMIRTNGSKSFNNGGYIVYGAK